MRCLNYMDLGLEAQGGIEPSIKVLQTFVNFLQMHSCLMI